DDRTQVLGWFPAREPAYQLSRPIRFDARGDILRLARGTWTFAGWHIRDRCALLLSMSAQPDLPKLPVRLLENELRASGRPGNRAAGGGYYRAAFQRRRRH